MSNTGPHWQDATHIAFGVTGRHRTLEPMTAEELAEMHERMRHAELGMKMD